MRFAGWIFFFLGIATGALRAQCPISVEAGPDQLVCGPSGLATLQASVSGSYQSFSWSPTLGMINPNTLQPQVVVTQNQTYTLTVETLDLANNLVVNGDFSAGDFGFTSDYVNNPSMIFLPGNYAIVTSPDLIYSNFPPCDDHSPGQGNLLLVNGATTPNQDIWCQSVSVTPNTDYLFSAWVGTIVPFSLANLQFFVNGMPLGTPFTASSDICSWEEFTATWNAGSSTTAEICIQNLNTANLGNDFGIDDISFIPVCVVTDEVTVDVVQVQAVTPFLEFLPCNGNSLLLSGSGSTVGPSISYQWTTVGGNIVAGANSLQAEVDATGEYVLTVQYNDGQLVCEDVSVVFVAEDPAAPVAFAGVNGQLSCDPTSQVQLSSAGSSSGPQIAYLWETNDGLLVGNPSNAFVQAAAAGTYQLTVTNTQNNCSAVATVVVMPAPGAPTATASDSLWISCFQPVQALDASGSSAGPNLVYSWTTTDGDLLSGTDSLVAQVDAPGVYTFTVTDTLSGCLDSVSVSVFADFVRPDFFLEGDTLLSCLADSLWLQAIDTSNASMLTYAWTSPDGHFLTATDGPSVWVDAPGVYEVVLQVSSSGCLDSAAITVFRDTLSPSLALLPAGPITCSDTVVTLTTDTLAGSGPLSFFWTTQDGLIVSDASHPDLQVAAPGWYFLELVDSGNGCVALDSIQVSEDRTPPAVSAGPDKTLDCVLSSVVLEGMLPPDASDVLFFWETMDGTFSSPPGELQPTVDFAGLFILTALDTVNGCVGRDSATVVQAGNLPVVSILPPDTLTCVQTQIVLTAQGSAGGVPLEYAWTAQGGPLIGPADTATVWVDAPGIFTVVVTEPVSGCQAQASVEVLQDTTTASIALFADGQITCQQSEVSLLATIDSFGSEPSFLWSTTDGILAGAVDTSVALALAPGTYSLQVVHPGNGCIREASVEVAVDTLAPLVDAGAPALITCADPTAILVGSTPAGNTLTWVTTTGMILSDPDSLIIQVGVPGWYHLEALDPANGCQGIDSVWVETDTLAPQLAIGFPEILTCADTTVTLTAQANTAVVYSWSTQGGQILGPTDLPDLLVQSPGWYGVEVQTPLNGCSAVDSVFVSQDTLAPVVTATASGLITCLEDQVVLESQVINGGGAPQYEWSTADGVFLGSVNSPTASAAAAGVYALEVINPGNGCTGTAWVAVGADQNFPLVEAGVADTLTCLEDTQTLSGSYAATGNNVWINWSTTQGEILGGLNTLAPEVGAPGWYLLSVADQDNGCTAVDSVWVGENKEKPQLAIEAPSVLTCAQEQVTLDASGSDQGAGFQWIWSTTDGLFLSGTDGLTPTVGWPGFYQLQIVDLGNGCADSLGVVVAIDTLPPQVEAPASLELFCFENDRTLTGALLQGGSGWGVTWQALAGTVLDQSVAGSQFSATLTAGVYQWTVVDPGNACSTSGSVVVTQESLPPPQVEVFSPRCKDQTGTIDLTANVSGTPPYLFSIDGGNSFQAEGFFEGLSPGLYSILLQDVNGCESDTTVTVQVPLEWQVNVVSPVETPIGQPIVPDVQLGLPSHLVDSVRWTPAANLSCTDCLQPQATPFEDAQYALQVWDIYGCLETALWEIKVIERDDLYIPNVFTPNDDGINDFFCLYAPVGAFRQVRFLRIFSRWGELLYSGAQLPLSEETAGWNGRFRGARMPPGVYTFWAEVEKWDGTTRKVSGSFTLIR